MNVEFPSSVDAKFKLLDRYTIRDVARAGLVALIGWPVAGSPGAAAGLLLGFVLAEVTLGGKPLDAHLIDAGRWLTTAPSVASPDLQTVDDEAVVLDDGTALGIVEVSSQELEYASEPAKRANRDTVSDLLSEIDYPVELHSRQRQVDMSEYQGAAGSTVTTDHYVVVKESRSTVAENRREVTKRCIEIRNLLTGGDLSAERLTGSTLRTAVKRLYVGSITLTQTGYTTEHGQKRGRRLLYVDEYPDQLPLGWIAEVLNTADPGLVDVVQVAYPIADHQRTEMDRTLARIQTELSASRKPSRQARLRDQEQDVKDLIEAEATDETLINYGVYIVARGESQSEAAQTLDSVKSVLNRLRVEAGEPRRSNHAVKAVSAFHRSRFDKSDVVPSHAAATGFSFATKGTINPDGIKMGTQRNGAPVILDRFSWEAGHITVMGKIGSGKTFWTGLSLLRAARTYDDLEIHVIDPKRRDYGDIVDALDGETVVIDNGDVGDCSNDVVRYTVEEPARDNTEALAETVWHVYSQASQTDTKTLVVIDEAHRIITKGDRVYQDGIQAVSTLIRESRHRNVAATLVTQNADEFTRSNEGQNILRNVDCNLFFKQEDVASRLADFFRLSETERTELRKLRTGTEVPFSEALVRGPVNTRLKIDAQPDEHRLLEAGTTETEIVPAAQPAVSREPDAGDTGEAPGRTDGGQTTGVSDPAHGRSETRGVLSVAGTVLGGPIGLFECGLLTGFPVIAVLHGNGALRSVLPVAEGPLNGTLIDVLGVWAVVLVAVELVWILVLSVDNWLARTGK